MPRASLRLLLPLAALVAGSACRPNAQRAASRSCNGSSARAVSHTGTLNVVWGASTHFYLRTGDRTLELLIDRPERVSSDVLQGLSSRQVRVDGRETSGASKICADDVTVLEGTMP